MQSRERLASEISDLVETRGQDKQKSEWVLLSGNCADEQPDLGLQATDRICSIEHVRYGMGSFFASRWFGATSLGSQLCHCLGKTRVRVTALPSTPWCNGGKPVMYSTDDETNREQCIQDASGGCFTDLINLPLNPTFHVLSFPHFDLGLILE